MCLEDGCLEDGWMCQGRAGRHAAAVLLFACGRRRCATRETGRKRQAAPQAAGGGVRIRRPGIGLAMPLFCGVRCALIAVVPLHKPQAKEVVQQLLFNGLCAWRVACCGVCLFVFIHKNSRASNKPYDGAVGFHLTQQHCSSNHSKCRQISNGTGAAASQDPQESAWAVKHAPEAGSNAPGQYCGSGAQQQRQQCRSEPRRAR